MRYVFILMMLMSFSGHAEWIARGDNVYFKDVELNTDNQRVSVQILDDFVDSSLVHHMQYQCENRVPIKERNFWHAYYEGRMAQVTLPTEARVPFKDNRFTVIAIELCRQMDQRSKRNSPERNPLY
ncbi:MAG: hypothetical protein O3A05_10145 [Proteobacteria bacterium]|nr:hypothetical protein [Pseudomonadota bacterium]